MLALVLTALGDSHRRAGRYQPAERALERAMHLVEGMDSSDVTSLAAVLTLRGIVAKERGDYPAAAHFYRAVGRIHDEFGAPAADAATLQHNFAGLAHAKQHARRGTCTPGGGTSARDP
jgi:hypothetical protein